MFKAILLFFLVLFISGCGKPVPRDEKEKGKLGYQEAKTFCSQCHTMPFADQHPPAAWPYVIGRMEGYIRSSKRMMPNQAEHDAIMGYFQKQ